MEHTLESYIEELKGQGVEVEWFEGRLLCFDHPFKYTHIGNPNQSHGYYVGLSLDVVYPNQFQAFQSELTQVITICETLNRLLRK